VRIGREFPVGFQGSPREQGRKVIGFAHWFGIRLGWCELRVWLWRFRGFEHNSEIGFWIQDLWFHSQLLDGVSRRVSLRRYNHSECAAPPSSAIGQRHQ